MAVTKSLKCPECNYRAARPQTMGVHRRQHHGVLGTSSSSLYKYNKLKAAEKSMVALARKSGKPAVKRVVKASQSGILRCPECNEKFSGPRSPLELGRHRRVAHGVLGATARRLKRLAASGSQFSCQVPGCSVVAANARALAVHQGRMHKDLPSNGLALSVPPPAKGGNPNGRHTTLTATTSPSDPANHQIEIPLELIAHAVGKIEGLVERLAIQNDLPYGQLAVRCADYFRVSARG